MFWNSLRLADLPLCLESFSEHLGDGAVGRSQAFSVWQQLSRHPSFAAVTIECDQPLRGERIVGFGAAVFVQPNFVEAELAHPRPGLNERVIASVASGRSVVLSQAELKAANSSAGLYSVVLCGAWRHDLLNDEQTAELQMLLAASFVEIHAGYRLKMFISESIGAWQVNFAVSSGVWRIVRSFENEGSALLKLTKEQAFAIGGSIANVLFHYREPILGLREFDRKLLIAALTGATDEELASKLNLSLASVKKGWVSLFARVTEMGAAVWPLDSQDGSAPMVRGKQKRHHLIAYIRSHPEELRPYEQNSRAKAARL